MKRRFFVTLLLALILILAGCTKLSGFTQDDLSPAGLWLKEMLAAKGNQSQYYDPDADSVSEDKHSEVDGIIENVQTERISL